MQGGIPPCIPDSHLYRVTNTRCRIGMVIFSLWWAHSCPEHVEKSFKHTKKICAPSWFCLQDYCLLFQGENLVQVDGEMFGLLKCASYTLEGYKEYGQSELQKRKSGQILYQPIKSDFKLKQTAKKLWKIWRQCNEHIEGFSLGNSTEPLKVKSNNYEFCFY